MTVRHTRSPWTVWLLLSMMGGGCAGAAQSVAPGRETRTFPEPWPAPADDHASTRPSADEEVEPDPDANAPTEQPEPPFHGPEVPS